ncbi:Glutamyl aminopeptidase [Temnothorax longispinosus]|uniref:Aminopeptidase n=1 Tax=Temnothorax longispinosus TaxID=300112 RepID=A0A4S2L1N7_9HYME|nr:Glutamyl aminopeptidase [Temnothorax longispinosus]
MNLKNIRSALMFIIAITTITGGKSQNNFNISSDFRLSMNYTVPMHYSVKLAFINTKMNDSKPSFIMDKYNYFYGDSNVIINIFQPIQNITLHAINIHLSDEAKLIKKNGLIYKSAYTTSTTNSLDLFFNDTLFPGLYKLKLEFYGQISHNNSEGFFRNIHVNEQGNTAWLIATHIQTIGARRIFPCWDDPQIRTTFDISIQHPSNSVALSNMPTQGYGVTNDNNNDTTTYFFTTPPLSTYHIAIAVTNYNYTRINSDVSLWCRECDRKNTFKFAKRVIETVTSHLESEFKDLDNRQLDHVAIPNFPEDSTSKWGLIFYREENLIYNEQDPIMRKIEVARLIAHKIAYQWFGNAISSSRWSFFWLHDGLATLFGEEAIVKTLNNSEILDFFIVQNQYESLHLDDYFKMNPPLMNNLSEINSLFSFPCCIKVPIVLRMLKNAITDKAFRSGIHTYLHQHMFKSVTFYEFWLIQVVTAESYGYHITDKFLNWILYEHYPFLKWTQNGSFYGELAQASDFSTLHYGQSYKTRQTLERHASIFALVIQGDMIIIDIQQAGYYRFEYSDENWHKIAHYLNSSEYKNVSAINRAKIIDDACYFTIARKFNIRRAMDILTFWKITNYLRQETNYVAWYPMFKMFEYLSTLIPFSEHTIGTFIKQKLKELLVGPFEILIVSSEHLPENDLTICLKQEIFKWACTLRHSPCLEMAQRKLLMHYKNPASINSPEWKEWAFCKGLLKANISVWNIVKYRWMKNKQYELLPYLACTRDPSIILEYLPYVLWNPMTYETQDTAIIRSYINIFHTFVAKHANNYFIFTNVLLNLKRIKPKEISIIVALTDIINHVYSEKHLNENPRH